MRLYLDANAIIYSIEGIPDFRQAALAWLERIEVADGAVITSLYTRVEPREVAEMLRRCHPREQTRHWSRRPRRDSSSQQ